MFKMVMMHRMRCITYAGMCKTGRDKSRHLKMDVTDIDIG
jgi:hypothetical protein